MARIRNGRIVSFGRSALLLGVQGGAQVFHLGYIDLLDIGDVRDAGLCQRHFLGDLAPEPDDLDLLHRSVRHRARRIGGLRPACGKRVEILMRYPPCRTTAGHLAQIDARFTRTQPHGRRGQRLLALGAGDAFRGNGLKGPLTRPPLRSATLSPLGRGDFRCRARLVRSGRWRGSRRPPLPSGERVAERSGGRVRGR